jgi:regulatory protein
MISVMRIESVKAEPDRAGRFWVTFEDGTRLGLYRQTVEDFSLYPGRELSEQEWLSLNESAGQMSAKMRAVRIVAATAVSKQDLQHRLVQKGEDPQQAAEAVAWMEEMHLVDDAETARQIVSRCVAKGYGLQRAKQALYEKKIPKQYWDEALEDYPDQNEHILRFLRSKITDPSDEKQVKKAVDALLRRGHNYGHIRAALRRMDVSEDDFPEE